jgi:hypothetical protein
MQISDKKHENRGREKSDQNNYAAELKLKSDLKSLNRKYALENLDKRYLFGVQSGVGTKIVSPLINFWKIPHLKISNLDKCISISVELSQNLSNCTL